MKNVIKRKSTFIEGQGLIDSLNGTWQLWKTENGWHGYKKDDPETWYRWPVSFIRNTAIFKINVQL